MYFCKIKLGEVVYMKSKKELFSYDDTALVHAFQEACSNKDFKDYVYSLNIEEDILNRYTSCLQDAFEEHNNCINCKSIESCKNKIRGYKYSPTKSNGIIVFNYEACDKEQKELKNNEYKKNLELYDIPIYIKNASFNTNW